MTLVISVVWNYRAVTSVHCGRKAQEFLPSISACIGDFSTQRWTWRSAMTLYVWQRLLTAPLYYRLLGEAAGFGPLNTARCAVFFTEQLCLMMLTTVSSSENLVMHQLYLASFALCTVVGMCMTYALCGRWLRRAT
ncbi:unnamed protein product, partial [Prorocentrum cordatum]